MALIVIGFAGVKWMNIGSISGFVRQETLVKLKILFTLLEVRFHIDCLSLNEIVYFYAYIIVHTMLESYIFIYDIFFTAHGQIVEQLW